MAQTGLVYLQVTDRPSLTFALPARGGNGENRRGHESRDSSFQLYSANIGEVGGN